MNMLSLEVLEFAAAAVRKMAMPTELIKKHCATTIGRAFVDRSAASAFAVL